MITDQPNHAEDESVTWVAVSCPFVCFVRIEYRELETKSRTASSARRRCRICVLLRRSDRGENRDSLKSRGRKSGVYMGTESNRVVHPANPGSQSGVARARIKEYKVLDSLNSQTKFALSEKLRRNSWEITEPHQSAMSSDHLDTLISVESALSAGSYRASGRCGRLQYRNLDAECRGGVVDDSLAPSPTMVAWFSGNQPAGFSGRPAGRCHRRSCRSPAPVTSDARLDAPCGRRPGRL